METVVALVSLLSIVIRFISTSSPSLLETPTLSTTITPSRIPVPPTRIPTPTHRLFPTPYYTQNQGSLTIISKGEVALDRQLTGRLVSVNETGGKVWTTYQFRNNSSASQKIASLNLEMESFSAYDESKRRMFSSRAYPIDGEYTLAPGELKTVTVSYDIIPKPYQWYYWGASTRFFLGSSE